MRDELEEHLEGQKFLTIGRVILGVSVALVLVGIAAWILVTEPAG